MQPSTPPVHHFSGSSSLRAHRGPLLLAAIVALIAALALTSTGHATTPHATADGSTLTHTQGRAVAPWHHVASTWYGPGFYGHRLACADTPGLPDNLLTTTRGVASTTLPCGTRIVLRAGPHRHEWHVRVIDRGPYGTDLTFDLTGRTARELCACRRPYTPLIHDWRFDR